MKARRLPVVVAMLIGAGMLAAAEPAATQGASGASTPGASTPGASGQVAPSGAAAQGKGDAKAAEQKIGACTGCHAIPGYRASYPMVYSVPMIHGQSAKYIENALNAYRSGDRGHPTMRAIAGSLTDQDIADLAAYYGKSQETK